jgi:uncharacterized protein YbbC (DUF1343 family)
LNQEFRSFVGWYKIPLKHGLSLGELGKFYVHQEQLKVDFQVIEVEGLQRKSSVSEFEHLLPRMASPNMPHSKTMAFFPISVLLEGTNISEGRGTTCPFQAIGAPFLDENELLATYQECLEALAVNSKVTFRTHRFLPLFDKFTGKVCRGIFLDTSAKEIKNVFGQGIALLAALCLASKKNFSWRANGYEYNFDHNPMDLILGARYWRDCFERLLGSPGDRILRDETFQELKEHLGRSQVEAFEFSNNSRRFAIYS